MAGTPADTNDEFPWWLAAAAGIAFVIAIAIAANGIYSQVFNTVIKGVWTTLFVTAVGFSLASLLGLGLAMMGLSRFKALRQVARFYVEIIRGVPMTLDSLSPSILRAVTSTRCSSEPANAL